MEKLKLQGSFSPPYVDKDALLEQMTAVASDYEDIKGIAIRCLGMLNYESGIVIMKVLLQKSVEESPVL